MAERWRTDRNPGRTIYIGERLVGLMDTPLLADQVVAAVNATQASYEIQPEDLTRSTYNAPDQLCHQGDRGVELTHLPTGLTARCHSERTQLRNTARCIDEIRAALMARIVTPDYPGRPGRRDGDQR